MIDISDGLTQDLLHILKARGLGAVIYEHLLPLSREAKSLSDALYMGEDFELLFTLSRQEAKKLYNKGMKMFKPIGEIIENKYGLRLVKKNSSVINVMPKGYRHF